MNEEVQKRQQRIRRLCLELKAELSDQLPDGREKSLVNTKIDEAMLWAAEAFHMQDSIAKQKALLNKEEVNDVR